MIVVIIAGGSGSRLWPVSTPTSPKHLLRLIGNRSLLEQTYTRVRQLTGADNIYIVTEQSHSDEVERQLDELSKDKFIVEPARRGTANCIVAAMVVIEKNHDSQEPIVFLWADHYIRDTKGFVHTVRVAAKVAVDRKNVTLIGIEPTYPSTGLGYIEKGELGKESDTDYPVAAFKEKPDFPLAQDFLATGNYLWNCGYFVVTTEVLMAQMKLYSPELYGNYQKLAHATDKTYRQTYLNLEMKVIEYEFTEKAKAISVVPASFDWADIGSFNDIYEVSETDEQGVYREGRVYDINTENAFIRNDEDKPVAVIGLDNIVVVNTKDGILVARKDLSQKVKDITELLKRG